jgi:PEP-CTERM motif
MRIKLLVLFVFWALSAVAKADVLVPGSTFDVFLEEVDNLTGITSPQDFVVTVGSPLAFTYGAVSGTMNVTQTSLGGGEYQIQVQVLANGDLYPATPNGGYGTVGAGVYDPFNLTSLYDLTAATIEFSGPGIDTGALNAISVVSNTTPWDGYFPQEGKVVGVFGTEGKNLDDVTMTMTVSPVATPEPGSLALLGTGVLGCCGLLKRRWSQQRMA